MIATRKNETGSDVDVEVDLFAGLTFPDAPTEEITALCPATNSTKNASSSGNDMKTDPILIVSEVPKPTSSVTINNSGKEVGDNSLVKGPNSNPLLNNPVQLKSVITNDAYKSLYSIPTEPATTHYPVIPEYKPKVVTRSTTNVEETVNRKDSSEVAVKSTIAPIPNARAVCIQPNPMNLPPVGAGAGTSILSNDSTVYSPSAPSFPTEYASESTVHQYPNAVTSYPQSATNEAMVEGDTIMKYVCCGRCRQWLKVPLSAGMVLCPTCNVMNDCSQSQTPQNTGNMSAPVESATAQRLHDASRLQEPYNPHRNMGLNDQLSLLLGTLSNVFDEFVSAIEPYFNMFFNRRASRNSTSYQPVATETEMGAMT